MRGSARSAPPLCRLLCLLSCRSKKVRPPAGTSTVIAYGDVILRCKITGRVMTRPYNAVVEQYDNYNFLFLWSCGYFCHGLGKGCAGCLAGRLGAAE